MTEAQKPPLLNRILRCSACAKKLLYGILLTVGLSSMILLFTLYEIPINPHYFAIALVLGLIIGIAGGLVYGAYKGFNAYCDRENLYYDDFIAAFLGLACCFGIFLLGLAIFVDEGNLFNIILEAAESWEFNNVQ